MSTGVAKPRARASTGPPDSPSAGTPADAPTADAAPTKPAVPQAPSRGVERHRRANTTATFLGLAVLLFAKVLWARWLIMGPGRPVAALLSEAVLIIGAIGLVDLFFKRWRFTAYVVLDVLFSVFLVALTEYATYFDRMLAVGAFKAVGEVGAVMPSVVSLLSPAYLLFVLDIPLILVFAPTLKLLAGNRRRLGAAMLILFGLSIAVSPAIALWAGVDSVRAGDVAVARSHGVLAYESAAVVRAVFGYGLFGTAADAAPVVTAGPSKGDIDYLDPESVQAAIDAVSRRGTGERIAGFAPGAYAGANVIVIQVESLQHFAIDSWVTPRLDAIAKESWYFPNGFSQAGLGTTADAEFAMNASLYPPASGPASVEYVDRAIPALPRLLAEQGYYSFTMHANTARYWNRKELYPALGFSKYYDRTFFGADHTIGMGTADRTFFKKALPVIEQQVSRGPFYCQLVTITPHHPFRMPASMIDIELPTWLKGSTVGNYFEAMNYEDRSIGWFVDKLKDDGLWDTSIVVIYGDHYGLRPGDLEQNENLSRLELVLEHRYTLADRANIPVIIHLPGQESGVYCATPVGQVDIMPTLADALGVDLSSIAVVGRSAFEATRPLIVGRSGLPIGSFVNDKIAYLANESFESGTALFIRTREAAKLLPEYRQDYDAAKTLEAISDTYARSLPERAGSKGTAGAIIPKKNAW